MHKAQLSIFTATSKRLKRTRKNIRNDAEERHKNIHNSERPYFCQEAFLSLVVHAVHFNSPNERLRKWDRKWVLRFSCCFRILHMNTEKGLSQVKVEA